MKDNIINTEIAVLGGDSLNLILQNLTSTVEAQGRSNTKYIFSTLAQLELSDTATLLDIAKKLPLNSVLLMEVYGGTHGSTMPLPYYNDATSPSYMSGYLSVVRNADWNKCYFYWKNEYMQASAEYNKFNGVYVSPWRFMQTSEVLNNSGVGANYWGKKISNIWVGGTYYFNGTHMKEFTDAPVDQAGFLKVVNSGGKPNSDKFYEFTVNSIYGYKYQKQNTGNWIYLPLVHSTAVADNVLRVGDMKINGEGNLMIRTNSSTVKAL